MSLTEQNRPAPGSAFDQLHPPPREIIEKCVHCGFCLPVCPTYLLWGEEMDSPRGRIYLMKMASEGTAGMSGQWVGHFDACLGCLACTTACPSGVDYGKLIEATRAQIEQHYQRPVAQRLSRRLLLRILTHPDLLHRLLLPLRVCQRVGLQSLVHKIGLVKLLPGRLRSAESLLPRLTASSSLPEFVPAQGGARRRVGVLLGCVQRVMFPQVNAATVRVLAAEGCDVVVPREQPCCGALLVHTGGLKDALELARKTIEVFERAQVDTIVINAAGCGSNLKDYGYLLREDPQYADRAKQFSARCKDVAEFLAELGPRAARNPLRLRVAYHDACHLQHAQGVRAQPRSLLAQIPELELKDIPEAPICCGSAGIYNLIQADAANALGDRKAALVVALQPDLVATGNPGCILQMRSALARKAAKLPVVHTIELLDASIRGAPPQSLTG